MMVTIGEENCRLQQVSRANMIGSIFTLKGYGGNTPTLQKWADEHNYRILKQHGPKKCFQVVLKRIR